MRSFLAALAIAAAFVGAALAAGGLDYGAERAPRPCERRVTPGEGLDPAQRFALRAIDALACRLGKSREQLVLDLAERGVDTVQLERRLRQGLGRWLEGLRSIFGGAGP